MGINYVKRTVEQVLSQPIIDLSMKIGDVEGFRVDQRNVDDNGESFHSASQVPLRNVVFTLLRNGETTEVTVPGYETVLVQGVILDLPTDVELDAAIREADELADKIGLGFQVKRILTGGFYMMPTNQLRQVLAELRKTAKGAPQS
ncbi:hypothetical protein G7Y41_08700 [Schaalia sp. ZJ405]|uniref:hypothetical protein n=1 Tax=Schaalia sp. ZJ405 TaxID=2709403 RepID=UPI0013ED526C|nr:hypothetical protein [Schaalia sp. ZJ405]QPK81103.1 hypothetical protein G7Y41_08700 [Schaalia sp. ZJ405]